MAIRKVARMGHPVLRQKARGLRPEELKSPELDRLLQDMAETMKEYGGIGIAAPQVHEAVQVALIEFSDESSRYPDMGSQPLTVFINPKVTVLDPKLQGYWEGCLSVPELRGFVERPRKVKVEYLDRSGQAREIIAEGFLATVFQHELDHLDGTLFVDRITDKTKLAFMEEYRRYWLPQEASEEEDGLAD